MPKVYIAMDGDDAGEAVTEAILHGTEEDAIAFSEAIKTAFMDITDWVTDASSGKIVFEGGDNILFVIDADDPNSIAETARQMYKHHTGHSATAGVGATIQEAHKSLVVGKNTGKDKTVVWNEAAADLYEDVRRKEERVKEFEKEVPLEDAKADDHQARLEGAGYGRASARMLVDLLYRYGKSKKLPGNTDAEKYLIDGEGAWDAFLEKSDAEAKDKETAALAVGQKILIQGKLGIIRRIGKINLAVELMDSTGITVPLSGDYQAIPMVRSA